MKYRVWALIVVVCLAACCPVYAEDSSEYLKGKITDGIYVNEAMGVKAYFGENWRILSDREISLMMGAANSISPTIEELTNGNRPVFYVMTKDGRANINLTIGNLGVMGGAMAAASKDVFIDMTLDIVAENLKKTYSEMGFNDISIERVKMSFLGSKCDGVYVTVKVNDTMSMYQKLPMFVKGEYAFSLNVTSVGYDITDNLLAMFEPLK